MSTIVINELRGLDVSGSISVVGEGNSTTTNLQQGLAKAWVNYGGDTALVVNQSFHLCLQKNLTQHKYVNLWNLIFLQFGDS